MNPMVFVAIALLLIMIYHNWYPFKATVDLLASTFISVFPLLVSLIVRFAKFVNYPVKVLVLKWWAEHVLSLERSLQEFQRKLKVVEEKYDDEQAVSKQARDDLEAERKKCNDEQALLKQARHDLEVERNRVHQYKTLLGLEKSKHAATRAQLNGLSAEHELAKQDRDNLAAEKHNAQSAQYRLELERNLKRGCQAGIASRDAQIKELQAVATKSGAHLSKQITDARLRIKELEQANQQMSNHHKAKVAELKRTKITQAKTIRDQAGELDSLKALMWSQASAIKDRDVQLQELIDKLASRAKIIEGLNAANEELLAQVFQGLRISAAQ